MFAVQMLNLNPGMSSLIIEKSGGNKLKLGIAGEV